MFCLNLRLWFLPARSSFFSPSSRPICFSGGPLMVAAEFSRTKFPSPSLTLSEMPARVPFYSHLRMVSFPARYVRTVSNFDCASSPVGRSDIPIELLRTEISSLSFILPEPTAQSLSFSHLHVNLPPPLQNPPPKPPDPSLSPFHRLPSRCAQTPIPPIRSIPPVELQKIELLLPCSGAVLPRKIPELNMGLGLATLIFPTWAKCNIIIIFTPTATSPQLGLVSPTRAFGLCLRWPIIGRLSFINLPSFFSGRHDFSPYMVKSTGLSAGYLADLGSEVLPTYRCIFELAFLFYGELFQTLSFYSITSYLCGSLAFNGKRTPDRFQIDRLRNFFEEVSSFYL